MSGGVYRTWRARSGSEATTSSRARRASAACAALFALAVAGCADLFQEPAPPAGSPLALTLVTPAAAGGPADAYARADGVRVIVRRGGPNGPTVLDTTLAFVPTAAETRISAEVEIEEDGVEHSIDVTLLRGGVPLFRGLASVIVSRGGTSSVEIPLRGVSAQLSLRQEYPTLTSYGETLQLEGVALFATGDTLSDALAWSSLDPAIVEVTESGLATARSDGVARVRAARDDLSAEVRVSVQIRVASVDIAPSSLDLEPGETQQLTATLRDANGNVIAGDRVVTWSSSNTQIATVSTSGVVLARAPGTALVTAASEGVQGEAEVRVLPPRVDHVVVTPQSVFVGVGTVVTFTAAAYDALGNLLTDRPVSWASLDPNVATVVAGNALALAEGTARITATVEGVADTATLSVGPQIQVVVSPPEITLSVEQQFQFDVRVLGTNDQRVQWSSSAPDVVTVTTYGLVELPGCASHSLQVAITATSIPYPYASGEATVVVIPCSGSPPPPGTSGPSAAR